VELGTVLIRLPKSSPHCRLTRGSSLDLEIALSGVSAKTQPLRLTQPCRRCVETSGDVIKSAFTASASICRALSYRYCRTTPYIIGMLFCRLRINRLCELKRAFPKSLLKERQVLSSRISTARWKQWGKLNKSVVPAAAANSNKGLLIDTWPRITSGFTSNCSAGHLLKLQPRVASRDRAEARSHWMVLGPRPQGHLSND